MRRADRLFQIIEVLRRSDVVTARDLAQELEVAPRTIYRDIQDLVSSGVPIDGEAGVGYVLRSFDLPPVMFDRDEIEAMAFGMRIVESFGDSELGRAARRALDKIEAVLPGERRPYVSGTPLFAHAPAWVPKMPFDLAVLRRAIRDRAYVELAYVDAKGDATERRVRPLGMAFFGGVWLLLAWCELRNDFRVFRPDRITELDVTNETFEDEPDKNLDRYKDCLAAERRDADQAM